MSDLAAHPRDRKAVVMAIRRPYADAIMAGVKRWEFRRQPLPAQVRTVLIYRSGVAAADRGVIGTFEVAGRELSTAEQWGFRAGEEGFGHDSVWPAAGLTTDQLAAYSEPSGRIWAIAVGEVHAFPHPIGLSRFGIMSSPQSWVYAPLGWRSVEDLALEGAR